MLNIILQEEHGIPIKTCYSSLDYEEFENMRFDTFKLIRYIDFYGDTVFNNLQMDDLISDFKLLKSFSKQYEVINEIIELAIECKGSVHTYLKFVGD